MYLTAHWVRAPGGHRYLNAALYLHGDTDLPAGFWSQPPEDILRSVTTERPGTRVAARLDKIPGGNDVECFLDVVGEDSTSLGAVKEVLEELRRRMEARRSAREHIAQDGVVAAFSAVSGGQPLLRLRELSEAALALYGDRSQPTWPNRAPLVIEVTTEEEGLCFRLSDTAMIALQLSDQGFRAKAMRIRFDVKDAFEQLHGPIYSHVAEWLTGLSREELLERGGVRFEGPGREPIVWPAR